ncbi:MAG: hypothetical protein AAF081_14335 [Actinomycetota bacterium]
MTETEKRAKQVGALLEALAEKFQADASAAKPSDPPAPAEDPAALDSAWQKAADRIEDSATWIVRAFVAIVVAAIGTGPFLVFDEVDSGAELTWTLWGLAAAIGGAFVIIHIASEISLPTTGSLGLLLEEEKSDESMKTLRENLDRNQLQIWEAAQRPADEGRWRQPANIAEHIGGLVFLERDVWRVQQRLIDERLSEKPDDTRLTQLEKVLALTEERYKDAARGAGQMTSRAAYEQRRARFSRQRPPLFGAAAVVAVGLLVFLGFARVDMTDAGPLGVAMAEIDQVDALFDPVPEGCEPGTIAVELIGGIGTAEDPWTVRPTAGAFCDADEFSFDVEAGTLVVAYGGSAPTATTDTSDWLDELGTEAGLLEAVIPAWGTLAATICLLWLSTAGPRHMRAATVGWALALFTVGLVASLAMPTIDDPGAGAVVIWVSAGCLALLRARTSWDEADRRHEDPQSGWAHHSRPFQLPPMQEPLASSGQQPRRAAGIRPARVRGLRSGRRR